MTRVFQDVRCAVHQLMKSPAEEELQKLMQEAGA
jgi:hypothetical protein